MCTDVLGQRERERNSERENDKANKTNVNIWDKRIFLYYSWGIGPLRVNMAGSSVLLGNLRESVKNMPQTCFTDREEAGVLIH